MSTSPGGPLASQGYWLHHAALTWRAELGGRLRPLGLTPTQFDVLASLSWVTLTRDAPADPLPTQQEVADFAGIDRMMTSRVLKVLVDRDLVTRVTDPADARAYRLRLTPAGRSAVAESTAIARAVDHDLFAGLPDAGRVRAVLEQVTRTAGRRGARIRGRD